MTDASVQMEARRLALRWFRARFGANHPLPTKENSGLARVRLFEALTRSAVEEVQKARAAQAIGKLYIPVRPNFTLGDHFRSLLQRVTRYMGGR